MSQYHYTHLSYEERIIIENRHKLGEDYKEIAKAIGRCKETVWRELRRNGTLPDAKTSWVNKPRADARHHRGREAAESIKARKRRYEERQKYFSCHSKLRYNAGIATRKSRLRTRARAQMPKLEQMEYEEELQFIMTTLDSGWSPEQIAGRMKLEGIYKTISARAIREFIINHSELGLKSYLVRKGRKCRRQKSTTYNQTDNRRTIDERPEAVENLVRLGDLEGDTIVGKDSKDRLLTHVERKSGLVSISRIIGFDAYKVKEQVIRDIVRVFGILMLQTITYDNGVEFIFWKLLEQTLRKLDARLEEEPIVYFAHAYHSWERGRNENVNGLIRRFLPKGTDFKNVSDDDILMIEFMLNNRPRKRLGWLTPAEYYSANVALQG